MNQLPDRDADVVLDTMGGALLIWWSQGPNDPTIVGFQNPSDVTIIAYLRAAAASEFRSQFLAVQLTAWMGAQQDFLADLLGRRPRSPH